MPMQVVYFFALFTGVAWARDRRAMLGVVAGVVLLMFGWLTWQFAVGSGVEEAMSHGGRPLTRQGLFSPPAAYVVYSLLVNVVYFGGAIVGGQAAWRAALQRDRLAQQARTIDAQATSLQRQAVVEERLRIARELHDVVAHHVSVIGIQAAAARRVLRHDADRAETALRSVETSSREAVTQMRELLGTLRSGEDERPDGTRSPEPRLADVPALVEEVATAGVQLECRVVEDSPGAVAAVPGPVGLSLYRTVQEALSNIRRHSTASAATVFVRVDRRPEPASPTATPRWRCSTTAVPAQARPAPVWPARRPRAPCGPRRCQRDRPTRDRRLPRPRPYAAARGRVMTAPTRVLIVDDHRLVRSGFSLILSVEEDLEVVGEANDGAEAVRLTRELRPDVVLMDVQMPVMDGIEATRRIVADDLARVVILTTFDQDDYVFAGLGAGASGFLLKNSDAEHLVEAVRAVAGGHALLAPEVTRRVIEQMTGLHGANGAATAGSGVRDPRLDELTPRELEVLGLVGRGLSNAEVAARLFVGEATVKTHLSNVFAKLHLRDRVQAVVLAYEAGLILPGDVENPSRD